MPFYQSAQEIFAALRKLARHKKIDFNGYYFADADVRINNKERVGMVMKEVWDVTGYRFTFVTTSLSNLYQRTSNITQCSRSSFNEDWEQDARTLLSGPREDEGSEAQPRSEREASRLRSDGEICVQGHTDCLLSLALCVR